MGGRIDVVDFFAGCGGTSEGFRQAGLNILGGLDIDSDAEATYSANFPKAKFIRGDVCKMETDVLTDLLSQRNKPLMFAGCAPCQPFSRQNKSSTRSDPRKKLLLEFLRFIEAWLPEYIFVENVPGLQRIERGGALAIFKKSIGRLGYAFEVQIVPALWYGVPQTRERLVLMASRAGAVKFPQATHDFSKASCVQDWINGLNPLKAGERDDVDPSHQAAVLSQLNIRRIRATPEGGGRESWPEELVLPCHAGHRGHTDVYGRLAWGKPASGLTTRCVSYSNGRFGHPEQDRALSAREAACLQTFPRDYQFNGSLTSKARQIGNAVPPLMAKAFGQAFLTSLDT